MANEHTQNVENKEEKKAITIIVNGQAKEVAEKELSFAQIVVLAFGKSAADGNTIFTVTYRKGEGKKPDGSLVAGETIKIKEGEIFNVTETSKS
ncbi:MAG: hypothetical protein HKL90_14800 [Elusimicrobia bacterium]|nr:hypothetical protein [Elusimicrobiota bacterium]